MRILFVAIQLGGPAVRRDQVRARELLRGLSRRHSVTVVDLVNVVDRRNEKPVDCDRYIAIRIARSAMAMRAALALFSRVPLQAALYDSRAIETRIARIVADGTFDIAHVQLARLGPLLPALAPLPVVLDFIDALSTSMRNRAALDRGPLAWLAGIDAARMRRYERALCRRIGIGVVCAKREGDAIGDYRNLRVVPMGVAIDDADPTREFAPDSSEPRLIFTGNLGHFPNVDAATWFIESVMPLLRIDIPGITLSMAGARPARRLSSLASRNPDVHLASDVPDMRAHLDAATIAVAPMRAGSGQQTKILEAMSMRKPVVATSAAAAGIDAVDGEHLLIADTADEMRDAIVRLLRQWPLRMRLADAGRKLVESRHRWDDQVDAMDAIWSEAAGIVRRRRR